MKNTTVAQLYANAWKNPNAYELNKLAAAIALIDHFGYDLWQTFVYETSFSSGMQVWFNAMLPKDRQYVNVYPTNHDAIVPFAAQDKIRIGQSHMDIARAIVGQ